MHGSNNNVISDSRERTCYVCEAHNTVYESIGRYNE